MAASLWTVVAEGITTGKTPDLDEVRRALAVLCDPAHGVQLHCSFSRKHWECRTFRGDDLDGMLGWVGERAHALGVYYSLNPCVPTLAAQMKNEDAIHRRWLLIDVDRHKEPGTLDLSANEHEHEAARAAALRILDTLTGMGFPSPVLVCSGNGFHLLYRLMAPNNEEARNVIRDFLKVLYALYPTVGRECHDARRIAKLPGTWAQKGPDTADRPHRLARLLRVPEVLEVVSETLLADVTPKLLELAGSKPDQPPHPQSDPRDPPWAGTPTPDAASEGHSAFALHATAAGQDDGKAWARKALETECGKMALARPGEINPQLYRSAAALGNIVGAGLLGEQEVHDALLAAAVQAGANDPPKDEDCFRRALEKGKTTPRRPEPSANGTHSGAKPSAPLPDVVIVRASEIRPKKVRWLWPWRIPLGKLTTFAGIGGLGKTFVLCDIAARVSRGLAWPEKGELLHEPGEVLFISGEDDPDDTLVPRMISAGANLNRIAFLKAEVCDTFTLRALEVLTRAVGQLGPTPRLVVIDPPSSYLGGTDEHKNAELRSLLSPLKSWAADKSVAMVFNSHLNKGSGQKVEAMMRVMGSVAWVNAVRAAHLFTRMPDDPTKVLFVPMKNNLGPMRSGLVYQIRADADELATLEWLGEVDLTADAALNKDKKKRRVVAAEWLQELFSGRDEVTSREIFSRTKAETELSDDALREAKADMRIQARKKYDDEGNQAWWWCWSADDRAWWSARNTTTPTDIKEF